jgi:hypothetical protein
LAALFLIRRAAVSGGERGGAPLGSFDPSVNGSSHHEFIVDILLTTWASGCGVPFGCLSCMVFLSPVAHLLAGTGARFAGIS